MAVSDRPMTYEQFAAIKAQVTKELLLTPREWLTLLAPNLDSAGNAQNLLSTSGQVTEASASSINTHVTNMEYDVTALSDHYGFGNINSAGSSTVRNAVQRKRFQTTVTATAGGEIVAVAVGAPALAGYQCCMVITHVYSDQTDGSIALTWTSTGGLDSGLAGTTIATVANTVSPDWNQGLAWKATADNDTIDVACAAGQAGNAQNITFCGYYWYET